MTIANVVPLSRDDAFAKVYAEVQPGLPRKTQLLVRVEELLTDVLHNLIQDFDVAHHYSYLSTPIGRASFLAAALIDDRQDFGIPEDQVFDLGFELGMILLRYEGLQVLRDDAMLRRKEEWKKELLEKHLKQTTFPILSWFTQFFGSFAHCASWHLSKKGSSCFYTTNERILRS